MIGLNSGETIRTLPAGFVERLRTGLAQRRIQESFDWLDAFRPSMENLRPDDPLAASITGYLAQWVDVGYGAAGLLRKLLERFPEESRSGLEVEAFAHICIAEGIVALGGEDLDSAIAKFQIVLALGSYLEDQELRVVAHFGRARCLRRKGEYGTAYQETLAARNLAESLGLKGMAAVIRTHESWLVFR